MFNILQVTIVFIKSISDYAELKGIYDIRAWSLSCFDGCTNIKQSIFYIIEFRFLAVVNSENSFENIPSIIVDGFNFIASIK